MQLPQFAKKPILIVVVLLVLNAVVMLLCQALWGADEMRKYLYLFTVVPMAVIFLLILWRPLAPELATVEGEEGKKAKQENKALNLSLIHI